eukprot:TRINITY_DN6521_c0_g1_i1.p1 TRINITY_DN6521_c0_g1~~TRINITY_DN6521_c0_g1_i1.p1  ORF type:complete len:662 (+),score=197.41 TRINITY_DN6521_c0_g1_i1:114-2099(+)
MAGIPKGFVAAFNSLSDTLATVTSDNHLKIWDAATGKLRQDFIEPTHLAVRYTRLAWGSKVVQSKHKRKKKSEDADSELAPTADRKECLVALGTDKGTIVVWDVLQGDVAFRTDNTQAEGHTMRVNDVAFNSTGTALYSCGEDRLVCEWSATDGSLTTRFKRDKQAVQRIKVSPDDTVLASAGTGIKLWDLSSKKCLKKFTGHVSPVVSLAFSAEGRLLVSASSDRFVYVWDTTAESTDVALQALSCPSSPVHVAFNTSLSAPTAPQHLLGLTSDGLLSLWKFTPDFSNDADKSRAKPSTPTGRVTSDSGLLFATFSSDSQLLAVHGSTVKPVFERVAYFDGESGRIVKQTHLSAGAGGALLQKDTETPKEIQATKAQRSAVAQATVLGKADMPLPLATLPAPAVADAPLPKTKTKTITNKTFQAQLEEMGEKADEPGAIDAAVEALEAGKTAKQLNVPKADSLQAVLVQALHSKDNALLESCLAVSDPVIIRNTVQRLPLQQLLPFLKAAVEKFQAKPTRGIILVTWIRAVLVQHTAYLMTVPDLVSSLSGLYLTVDSRLSVFRKLLKLSGRLDLLLSQVSATRQATVVEQRVGVIYEEGPSDDDEDDDNDQDSDADSDEQESSADEANGDAEPMDDEDGDADDGDEEDDEADDADAMSD